MRYSAQPFKFLDRIIHRALDRSTGPHVYDLYNLFGFVKWISLPLRIESEEQGKTEKACGKNKFGIHSKANPVACCEAHISDALCIRCWVYTTVFYNLKWIADKGKLFIKTRGLMTSSFYGKIYSARYDHNEERFDLLDFYLDRRRQAGKPEPVLEPMCGTGSEHDEGRVGRCLAKQERFVVSQLVETELFDYHERLYDQKEFEVVLQTAGFTHIKATIGYETTEQQDILVFSCRKPDISANRQGLRGR